MPLRSIFNNEKEDLSYDNCIVMKLGGKKGIRASFVSNSMDPCVLLNRSSDKPVFVVKEDR